MRYSVQKLLACLAILGLAGCQLAGRLTFVRQDRAALVEFSSQFVSGISASITVTPR